MANGAVLNLLEATFQLWQDVLFVADGFNRGGIQVLRLNEIAEVFHTDALDFSFQFGIIRCPGLFVREAVFAKLVVYVKLYLL